MKKRIYALLLAAVMAIGVSACGASDTENNGTQAVEHSAVLNMGTGDTTGSYYAFGNLLAAHMSDAAGKTVDVVSTDGSAENMMVFISWVWPRLTLCPMRGMVSFPLRKTAK